MEFQYIQGLEWVQTLKQQAPDKRGHILAQNQIN